MPTFPATPHQLFLIPGGTPHGSGKGNVVLEISATPYLYSLRFYDWLRQGIDGELRPVHVDHAFKNLDAGRRGEAVARDLVQKPRLLRPGDGWHEELLGALPEMFFEVRRIALGSGAVAYDATDGRFHVLNVVEGEGVLVEPAEGPAHSPRLRRDAGGTGGGRALHAAPSWPGRSQGSQGPRTLTSGAPTRRAGRTRLAGTRDRRDSRDGCPG